MKIDYRQSTVRGRKHVVKMSLVRSDGRGVGIGSDVTQTMPLERRAHIIAKAVRTADNAGERLHLLKRPFMQLAARVMVW